MGLFPYCADLDHYKLPVVTILISLLCLGIHFLQVRSDGVFSERAESFCTDHRPRLFRMALKEITGRTDASACGAVMLGLFRADDRAAHLAELVDGIKDSYHSRVVAEEFRLFESRLFVPLTERLWYDPASWNPVRMVTATVAHGSWMHVLGNLYFFFAFAVTVELIIGWWRYLATIVAIGLGTGVAYTLASLGAEEALPTVGLSGVVMGMMALCVFFVPRVGIRCLLWFVVLLKRIVIPAWVLFAWYFGWDVYAMHSEGKPGVNLVAHVSGALIGAALGVVFFRRQREEVSLIALGKRG